MNEARVKRDIERAVEMAQSINDDMVEWWVIRESVPSGLMTQALDLSCRLATLKWYLEYISEGVSA